MDIEHVDAQVERRRSELTLGLMRALSDRLYEAREVPIGHTEAVVYAAERLLGMKMPTTAIECPSCLDLGVVCKLCAKTPCAPGCQMTLKQRKHAQNLTACKIDNCRASAQPHTELHLQLLATQAEVERLTQLARENQATIRKLQTQLEDAQEQDDVDLDSEDIYVALRDSGVDLSDHE